jgi:hypothetical protein
MSFYNTAKPHQAHGGKTPDSAYFATLAAIPKAARSEATMPAVLRKYFIRLDLAPTVGSRPITMAH